MVRFESVAGASLSMFDQDAKHMLEMMGHSGTIPSAIRGEDVAGVLQTFQAALEQAAQQEAEQEEDDEEEDNKKSISIKQRAYPLQQLLESAAAKQEDVMWRYADAAF